VAEQEQYMIRRYDWAAVPTLRNMLYSKARHQFVMGPFSSGKSSAMIMKILRYARSNPRHGWCTSD